MLLWCCVFFQMDLLTVFLAVLAVVVIPINSVHSQPPYHPGRRTTTTTTTTTEVPVVTDRADAYNYNISGDLNENGIPVFAVDQRTPTKEDLQTFGTYKQSDSMQEIGQINSNILSKTKENLLQFDIWVPYNVTEHGDLEFGATLKRNAVRNRGYQWPNGVVYYVIDNTFDYGSRSRILDAINRYHTYTCIRFYERTYESNYLHIIPTEGCFSAVGMQGGSQVVSLGGTCTYNVGTIIHEFMHALGFQHEQSRTDRDSYVWIYWQNIIPGMEYNFNKFDQYAIDHLGTSYDYYSVMHYPQDAFTINGLATIVPMSNIAIGNKNDFSETDIYKINTYYQCRSAPATCSDSSNGCANWARSGYCNHPSYQSYMHSNCPASCGVCVASPDPKPTGPSVRCRDMFPRCPEWSRKEECVNAQTRSWMQANCPASCGKCTASPVDRPCRDERKQCPEWARNGECLSNTEFMLEYCMRSCGQCDRNDCSDNHDLCETWAQYGECDKNPAYMHVECKSSCNLCGKNITLTPECADANGNCGLWLEEGRCETSKEFMEVMCPASCGICDGDAAPIPIGGEKPKRCGANASWDVVRSIGMILTCWLFRHFM